MKKAVAIHAEELYKQEVWKSVYFYAKWAYKENFKFTFFIYPFKAIVKKENIIEKIKLLRDFGHEIAQHTHFYKNTQIEKPYKVNDFSNSNIKKCIIRDFEYLEKISPPKGFVAGNWIVNQFVFDTLESLNFLYDCSHLLMSENKKFNQFEIQRENYNYRGKILCLSTTCSLGYWIKFRFLKKLKFPLIFPYLILFLHDYDFLRFSYKTMTGLFCFFYKKQLESVKEIAEYIKNRSYCKDCW